MDRLGSDWNYYGHDIRDEYKKCNHCEEMVHEDEAFPTPLELKKIFCCLGCKELWEEENAHDYE